MLNKLSCLRVCLIRNLSISRSIAARGKRDSKPDEKIPSESIFRGVKEAKKKLHDSGTNASGSMQEKMDKIKIRIENSKIQQKQNEENMKKFLESDEGRKNIAFGQGEIIKILVPILVMVIALQLFTGAKDA